MQNRFEDAGYGSGLFIFNLGMLFLTLVFMLTMPLVLLLMAGFKNKYMYCKRKHKSLDDTIRGNMWIRFIMEANLDIGVSGAINLYILIQAGNIEFETWFDKVNIICLFVLTGLVLIFPFGILGFYLW